MESRLNIFSLKVHCQKLLLFQNFASAFKAAAIKKNFSLINSNKSLSAGSFHLAFYDLKDVIKLEQNLKKIIN